MKLDRFDLKILEALQSDGRLPTARLADQVGLSTSPTWERVRKLEENGVLRGYHAEIDLESLTQFTQVIVPVALESHRNQDFRRFEQAITQIPEIVECWAVGGEVDYVLRFVVSNIEAYQLAIEKALRADLGIERYWTYLVTKSIKPYRGVPLGQLLKETEK
jgi:Lrp/AsnC family transcriptional regulator, regulator of ectoine-degradation genes